MDKFLNSKSNFDFLSLFEPAFLKAYNFLLSPKKTWEEVKSGNIAVKEFYINYWLVLTCLPAVCIFIQQLIFKRNVLGGVGQAFLIYFLYALTLFLLAKILKFWVEKFEGGISFEHAVQYLGYCATPGIISSIFLIFPYPVLILINLMISFYGIFLFAQAITWMTAIPKEKQIIFIIAMLASGMSLGLVLSILLYIF